MGDNPFLGKWFINDMDMWAADARDLMGPAFMEFEPDGTGSLRFIAVRADLDWELAQRDGRPAVEFSWEGLSEGDEICGRGWAVVADGVGIEGRIFIHLGDESSFEAARKRG